MKHVPNILSTFRILLVPVFVAVYFSIGPLKPVGLEDPKTGKQPFAVVQLRQDDAAGDLYNIVGFQTHLKWGEQKRVFSLIPGLENVEFVRYGVMHRNTFMKSPKLLTPTYQTQQRPDLFFCGPNDGRRRLY